MSGLKKLWNKIKHRVSRDVDGDPGHVWEIWTSDGYYVARYKDKGEAQRRVTQLRRSHPYQRYMLRRRRARGKGYTFKGGGRFSGRGR